MRSCALPPTLTQPTYYNEFRKITHTNASQVQVQKTDNYIPNRIKVMPNPTIIKSSPFQIDSTANSNKSDQKDYMSRLLDQSPQVQLQPQTLKSSFVPPQEPILKNSHNDTFRPPTNELLTSLTLKEGQFTRTVDGFGFDRSQFSVEDRQFKNTRNLMNATNRKNAEQQLLESREVENQKMRVAHQLKLQKIQQDREKYMNLVLQEEKERKY